MIIPASVWGGWPRFAAPATCHGLIGSYALAQAGGNPVLNQQVRNWWRFGWSSPQPITLSYRPRFRQSPLSKQSFAHVTQRPLP